MGYNSFRNDNNGAGEFALLQFRKSNNFASVTNLDLLGQILWSGYDGTTNTYKSASYIYCQAVGAPAVGGNVPSQIQFNTSYGTGTQLSMNIGQYGDVTINTQLGTALNINGVASGIAAQINNVGTSLDFSSTAQRITGNMSVIPHVDRLSFQSNVLNGATSPFILPNGTSQTASIVASNNSDPTNSAFAQLQVDSLSAKIVSGVLGTGTLLPFELRIGSANTAVSISTDRNVTINTPVIGTALTIVGGGETITAGDLTLSNGNVNLSTTSATSGIINVNSTRFMHAYGTNNTFLGSSAGNFTLTATQATAIGASAGNNITTGGNSVYIGYQAGNTVSGGNENTVIGSQAFASANSSQNVVIGYQAGYASTGFTACTIVGKFALNNTNTGLYNLMLGYGSGTNFTGAESSNICLHSDGVLADSNTLRIGQSTGAGNRQLNRAFICGIDGVNVGSVAKVVTMASDQLGTATITAGAGISVTPGANTITIATTNGIAWTEVTGTTQAMAVDSGYIANNAGLVTLTLPATAVIGDRIRIAGKGAGGWRCGQNAGQTINFGNTATTAGVAGYIDSTNQYDALELLCITADTTWVALSSVGNLNVV